MNNLSEVKTEKNNDWGIDIDLLEHNLSLSYEERLLEHQKALDLYLNILRYRKKQNENIK